MKMEPGEFLEKMRKASRLTGFPVEAETVDALYEELQGEDRADILYALKMVAHGGERPNLHNILKHLWQRKTPRLEQESRDRKVREEHELDKMPEGEVKALIEGVFEKVKGMSPEEKP